MSCKNFLFDLDGTLTDPADGITNALKHAQEKMGMPVSTREELLKFIGPPLLPMFQSEWGLTLDQSRQALLGYREYYADTGVFENEVYPGIPHMLAALNKAGARVFIASSKPELYCEKIAEHFRLSGYFEAICGSLMNETRTKKEEVIAYALEHFGLKKEETLMIGDREHDVKGAQLNGLACAGVLFGYGSREELSGAGACALLASPAELEAYLLKAAE